MIDQRMAAQFRPGGDALGKRLRTAPQHPWLTIVGIVADSKEIALALDGPIGMYLPYSLAPNPAMTIIVHTEADQSAVAGAIRQEIQRLDPDLAITGMRPLDDVIELSIAQRTFTAVLLATLAGIALVLSAAGIHGVLAYAVNQRTREIGVRMALGANRRTVLNRVMKDGLRLILAGIVARTLGALAATHLLSSLLVGVTPSDPVTFLAIAVFLTMTGGLACYVPARSAASVDPQVALRIMSEFVKASEQN